MSDAEGKGLTLWACLIGMLLVAAIFGVLGLALGMALKGSGFPGGGAKESVVVQMLGDGDRDGGGTGSSSTAAAAAPPVVLDLDVNAMGAPPVSSSGTVSAGGGSAGPPVSVNVAGAVASARAAPAAGAGDVPGSVDVETVGNPCGAPCPFCRDRAGDSRDVPGPCAYAELLDRVRFRTGSRAILASHAERLEEIANALDARTGVLLVIGHTDSCGGSRLARRRAKKVRKALKKLLARRSSWSGWERAAGNRVHAQAAGEDPRAPEGSCQARFYGSAAVYLIEGLR